MPAFVRAIRQEEIGTFMPIDEMGREQQEEVYDAAGTYALHVADLLKRTPEPDYVVVTLDDGRMIEYDYGIAHEPHQLNNN